MVPAYADTVTWTGGAGDSLWSTGNNWSSGAKPTNTQEVLINSNAGMSGTFLDRIRFSESGRVISLTVDVANLRIVNTAPSGRSFTVAGEGESGFITVTSNFTNSSGGNLFSSDTGLTNPLSVTTLGTLTLTNNSSAAVNFGNGTNLGSGGNSTGSDSITFRGAGSWSFNNNNTIGNFSTNGATLDLTFDTTFSGTVAFNAGTGGVNVTSFALNGGTLAIKNGAAVTTVNGLVIGVNGKLAGNAVVSGAATVAGTLEPGGASGSTSRTVTFNNGLILESTALVRLSIDSESAFDAILLNGGALNYNGTLDLTVNGTYGADKTWSLFSGFASKSEGFDFVVINGVNLTGSGGLWTGLASGMSWSFDETTGVLSTVPEPGTGFFLSMAMAGLLMLRGRRQFMRV